MIKPLKVFIGYDQVESAAYHTLAHSIVTRSSVPVAITAICNSNLTEVFTRARDPRQSNAFSFSRFLVPYLCDYQGWALFMDCDMWVRTDIAELFKRAESDKAVMVCKHDYTPSSDTKYLGNIQFKYQRKNWSSVMLFNCSHWHTHRLTPQYVNTATGLDLHRFAWCDDDRIGELPLEYNWLVGEYPHNPEAKIVHWTIGGPWFPEYCTADFAHDWFEEYSSMNNIAVKADIANVS